MPVKTCKPDWLMADAGLAVPEAPVALLLRSLMQAARKFSETCMYAEWIDIPTQENVQTYPFEKYLPEGFGVQYVLEVRYNGCCIDCIDDDCKDMCPIGYRLDDLTHITLFGYCPAEGEPDCKDKLEVKVALRIEPDACELPCDMLERFETPLMHGMMANLLSMPGKPWYNASLGEFHRNEFLGDIASAKCLVANKMNPEDTRVEAECLI